VLAVAFRITVLPSLSILFELFAVLPHSNFPAYAFSNWVATVLVGFGHGNTEIPFPSIWSKLGYGRTSMHTMHHYDPSKNFSIYSTWMDRIFGTYKHYADKSE
jgi:sterol desaturase/sphingolipid hydroxylase (fatty acid hydroxylase superfamily)